MLKSETRNVTRHPIQLKTIVSLAAIWFALTATSAAAQPIDDEKPTPLLLTNESRLWDSPDIPICWVDPDPAHENQRAWTRQALRETWEAVSAVRFTGWGVCGEEQEGIQISVADQRLRSDIGQKDDEPTETALNFTFEEWHGGFGCENKMRYCVRVAAVHEIGHALGFFHEQQSPDTPQECRDVTGSSILQGGIMAAPWDLYSVMNYCNPEFGLNGQPGDEFLSPSDVHGIISMYGPNPDNMLGANEDGDIFGSTLAVGDFNGDAIMDLAVGAPREAPFDDPESGAVFLYKGTARSGLRPDRVLTQTGLGANEDGDLFGSTLAAGDFNGDGFSDLAVGARGEAPGDEPKSGVVFLFKGGPSGLVPWRVVDQKGLGANERGDLFGAALASGDVNGDGKDDLAVGAPSEAPGDDPRSGYVFLFKGTNSGVEPWQGLDQSGIGANESGDAFGLVMTMGDFNGDDFADLAVSATSEAPGEGPRSGFVFIFRGSRAGLRPWKGLDQAGLGENEGGDIFGAALASGDVDGDGKDELAVSAVREAPGGDPTSGFVFLFKGTISGLAPWRGIDQAGLGRNEQDDLFGYALAMGDIDTDGVADLVVGAPGEAPGSSPQSGYAFVFRGHKGGLAAWQGLDQAGIGANELGDQFGGAVAIGKFEALGPHANIIVAAPFETVRSDKRSGYVFAYGIPQTYLLEPGLKPRDDNIVPLPDIEVPESELFESLPDQPPTRKIRPWYGFAQDF